MIKQLFIISLIVTFTVNLFSQNKKIGLCLSGGGAKGLAHIGLLKQIDSLNIKIDYITGTSMGAVIGGLYAAGYSGNEIDSIAHTADWDILLNQYVPMNEIWIDEKDEYGKYIGEIPFKKGKLQVTGLIEGQALLNFFTKLTRHVSYINNFNDLPIPFKCMAVDIVNVTPVILESGSLATAIRASMSIPTVFKPIKIDGRLLVDGGVMVNFPVQELKKMGAEFIIGSYTGGRVLEEKEMNTINKLLIQTSSFYGINESKDDIALCDIFNNLTENMKEFGAGDFKKSEKIIAVGKTIAKNALPQLIALAASQNGNLKNNHIIKRDSVKRIKVEAILLDSVATLAENKFVRNRLKIDLMDSLSFKQIERSVKRVYGTRYFFKSYYTLNKLENGNYNLKFKLSPDYNIRFKGALHYDNELGAGFIFNLTLRNLFLKNSRFLGTVDLAENPKVRLHYKQYLFSSKTAFNVSFLYERALIKGYNANLGGGIEEVYKTSHNGVHVGFNHNLFFNSSIYVGGFLEKNVAKPRYEKEDESFSISDVLRGVTGQFKLNTLNSPFFARKGWDIFIENKFVLIPLQEEFYRSTKIKEYTYITTNVVITPTDTFETNTEHVEYRKEDNESRDKLEFDPYNKLFFKINYITPITKKLSISAGISSGLFFQKPFNGQNTSKTNGYYLSNGVPALDGFFIGGIEQRARPQSFIPMLGAKEGEYSEYNFSIAQLSIQYEILNKLFIAPAISYYYSSSSSKNYLDYFGKINTSDEKGLQVVTKDPDNPYLIKDITYYYALYSYGLNVGYKSFLGPININISKTSYYNYWRIYFSVGYRF